MYLTIDEMKNLFAIVDRNLSDFDYTILIDRNNYDSIMNVLVEVNNNLLSEIFYLDGVKQKVELSELDKLVIKAETIQKDMAYINMLVDEIIKR